MVRVSRLAVTHNPHARHRSGMGLSGSGTRLTFLSCRLCLIVYIIAQCCILMFRVSPPTSKNLVSKPIDQRNDKSQMIRTNARDKNSISSSGITKESNTQSLETNKNHETSDQSEDKSEKEKKMSIDDKKDYNRIVEEVNNVENGENDDKNEHDGEKNEDDDNDNNIEKNAADSQDEEPGESEGKAGEDDDEAEDAEEENGENEGDVSEDDQEPGENERDVSEDDQEEADEEGEKEEGEEEEGEEEEEPDEEEPDEGVDDEQKPNEGADDEQEPDEGAEDEKDPDEGAEDEKDPDEGAEEEQEPDEDRDEPTNDKEDQKDANENVDGGDKETNDIEKKDQDDVENFDRNKGGTEQNKSNKKTTKQKDGNIRKPRSEHIMSHIDDPEIQETLLKQGTGPAKLGYVVDLVYERNNASFRNTSLPDEKYFANRESEVEKILTKENIAPNGKLSSCQQIDGQVVTRKVDCYSSTTTLFVYNAAPFPRTLSCQNGGFNTIPPGGVIQINDSEDRAVCLNQPAKYVHISTNKYDEGVVLTESPVKKITDLITDKALNLTTVHSCEVPCMVPSKHVGPKSTLGVVNYHELYVAGTNWKIIRSMNDPYYHTNSKVERTAFRRDVFYSTTSFSSSVPLSNYDFKTFNLTNTVALNWDKIDNKATYMMSKDCAANRRNKWLAAVQVKLPVESYGSCNHNTDLKPNESLLNSRSRIKLQKKNRISLVFDAGAEKDHISHQVWESLLSGAVPAILGATNVASHLPSSTSGSPTAIYASDFNNWDSFADVVKNVSENQTLWESFHEWRNDKIALQKFETKYNFTKISPNCRLCAWAFAKQYGLGWDHKQQKLKDDTNIPRWICMEQLGSKKTNIVKHPFVEEWTTIRSEIRKSFPTLHINHNDCSLTYSMSNAEEVEVFGADDTVIRRNIYYNSGVTDIVISDVTTRTDEVLALRLHFDVRNTDGAYFRDIHTLVPSVHHSLMSSASILDHNSKVTILTNWETQIRSSIEGVVEITIEGEIFSTENALPRIRIITEDFNPLYDKMTEFFPSYFGKIMTSDFMDPVEFFMVEA